MFIWVSDINLSLFLSFTLCLMLVIFCPSPDVKKFVMTSRFLKLSRETHWLINFILDTQKWMHIYLVSIELDLLFIFN